MGTAAISTPEGSAAQRSGSSAPADWSLLELAFAAELPADDVLTCLDSTSRRRPIRRKAWEPGHAGVPLLTDALASFECEIVAEHPGGDHWIVVGQIVKLRISPAKDTLIFFAGTSWRASSELKPHCDHRTVAFVPFFVPRDSDIPSALESVKERA